MHTTALRRIAVLIGGVSLAVSMTACADSSAPSGGLALVLGTRANAPAPELKGAGQHAVNDAVDAQSYLSVIVADGQPVQLQSGRLVASTANAQAQEADRERNRKNVTAAVAGAAAKTPEANLLGALDLAGRSLAEASGPHTIVVVDSGLSTVAPLDFSVDGMLDADAAELAGSLKAAGVLPSLTGATVVFSGLGDTAAPQQALGVPQRANLVDVWTAIAKAAGAAEVTVDQSPLSGASAEGLPPVKTVPVGAGVNCTATSVTLSGGDVSFKADSAELANRTAALARLQPIANQMVREGLSAKLTGSTARVGDEVGQRRLSQQRAEAVRQLLVDLGVPVERMTAVGVGSQFDGYVADHDAAGRLIPAAAAANRKVVLDLSGASTAIACS